VGKISTKVERNFAKRGGEGNAPQIPGAVARARRADLEARASRSLAKAGLSDELWCSNPYTVTVFFSGRGDRVPARDSDEIDRSVDSF
jgi:hypothetical protein